MKGRYYKFVFKNFNSLNNDYQDSIASKMLFDFNNNTPKIVYTERNGKHEMIFL